MHRGKRILVVAHCFLNSNAKIYPLAQVSGVCTSALRRYWDTGVGLIQLPCPELTYLGTNRWGMTKEQYDHPNFRAHCETILEPIIHQIEAFTQSGYEIVGILGMDGSPNCGVNRTCVGYRGGEINREGLAAQLNGLEMVAEKGVFMEVLSLLLARRGIDIPFIAVDEENPSGSGF